MTSTFSATSRTYRVEPRGALLLESEVALQGRQHQDSRVARQRGGHGDLEDEVRPLQVLLQTQLQVLPRSPQLADRDGEGLHKSARMMPVTLYLVIWTLPHSELSFLLLQ